MKTSRLSHDQHIFMSFRQHHCLCQDIVRQKTRRLQNATVCHNVFKLLRISFAHLFCELYNRDWLETFALISSPCPLRPLQASRPFSWPALRQRRASPRRASLPPALRRPSASSWRLLSWLPAPLRHHHAPCSVSQPAGCTSKVSTGHSRLTNEAHSIVALKCIHAGIDL